MAYASQSDITPRRLTLAQLVQLTDDAHVGAVNTEIVTEVLDDASSLIENYCRERYKLPLQQTKALTLMTVSIAVYKLYERRPGKMAETVQASYDDTLRLLKDIAAGKASLDQPVGTVDQSSSASLDVSRRQKKFSEKNLEGYI